MSRAKVSLIALLTLAVLASLLAGCGRKGIININGEKIMKEDFYARLQRVPVQQIRDGKPVTVPAGQYVIEQIIQEKMIEQFADKKGVKPSEEQINKKVQFIKKTHGSEFKLMLANQGKTEEEWKKQLEIEQAMANIVTKGVKITDAEVKAAYDAELKKTPSAFIRPEQIQMSMIVMSSKEGIDKAYAMLQQGQDFGTVAMKLSEHETRQNQGRIPIWIDKDFNQLPPVVVTTAFGLQPARYSAPFKAADKWVIVKLDRKRPKKTQTYEEVKDLLREQLAVRKGSQNRDASVEFNKFKKDAEITINAERYKGVADQIKEQASAALKLASDSKNTSTAKPTP